MVCGDEGDILRVDYGSSPVIREQDAWKALFKALSRPTGFHNLRIGLDPGARCSLAVYADNILVWAEKLDCRDSAERIKWLIENIEPKRYNINIGSGPGFETLISSLIEEGLEFRIIPEETTTTKPILSKISEEIGDDDILAAMTIALKP